MNKKSKAIDISPISVTFLSFIILCCIYSCGQNAQNTAEWTVIYRNDKAGNRIEGDKNQLIEAVRKGIPIRLGFGGRRPQDTLRSVEHVADVQFLTITNNNEVFGQITPIRGQRPFLEDDTVRIQLNHENQWTLILGTNGERSTLSIYDDPNREKASRRSRRGATWYAQMPISSKNKSDKARPLWD